MENQREKEHPAQYALENLQSSQIPIKTPILQGS